MLNSIHAEIPTGEPVNSQRREAVYDTGEFQFLVKSAETLPDHCNLMAFDPDICSGSALSGAEIRHRDMIGTFYNAAKCDHGSKNNGQTAETSGPSFRAGLGVPVPFVNRWALEGREGRFCFPGDSGARAKVCSRGANGADLARSPLIGDILRCYMGAVR